MSDVVDCDNNQPPGGDREDLASLTDSNAPNGSWRCISSKLNSAGDIGPIKGHIGHVIHCLMHLWFNEMNVLIEF